MTVGGKSYDLANLYFLNYGRNAAETHLITGGSVDISTSGVNYTIEGTFSVAGGGSATVDFTGPLSGSF